MLRGLPGNQAVKGSESRKIRSPTSRKHGVMTNRLRSITRLANVCHALKKTGELVLFQALLEESRAVRRSRAESVTVVKRFEILFRGKPCLKPQEFLNRIAIKR